MDDTQALSSSPAGETGPRNAVRRQIRGSSLLLLGKFISIGVNFVIQILIVRYLSKAEYGAFAYALSIVSVGETVVTLGLDRAITRYVPIYHERGDYAKMLGTLVMVLSTILSLGLAVVLAVIGVQAIADNLVTAAQASSGVGLASVYFGTLVAEPLIQDYRLVSLLLAILIVLSPLQALDNIFNGMFAVFSRPSAIFFQKYVLGPALRVITVALLVFGQSNTVFLALGYTLSGLVGILIFGVVLYRVMRTQRIFQLVPLRSIQIPVREVLAFTVPLLASDLVYVVMNAFDAVLLGQFHGTESVAALRAVQPTARFNQVILTSFALLFTPAAARMFARGDTERINDLYWKNAVWIAVLSFPIFALTFSLAQPLTLMLYEERYAQSAIIMALLSFGYYFNSATGQNGLTLKVTGRLRYIVTVDIFAAVLNLAVNLWTIPRYGALGAAVGTTVTLVIFNLLKQAGLMRGTGVRAFDRRYLRAYLVIALAAGGLLVVQSLLAVPIWVGVLLAMVASVLVVRLNRDILDVKETFPELTRIPLVRLLWR
ncbi:MAG: flippase [Anaerolineae bacterium]|nr:flippase [Anaerolineae bacterium]